MAVIGRERERERKKTQSNVMSGGFICGSANVWFCFYRKFKWVICKYLFSVDLRENERNAKNREKINEFTLRLLTSSISRRRKKICEEFEVSHD